MRYALYFLPEPGIDLANFGAVWLGRDVESGRTIAQVSVPGLDRETLAALTAEPRRYGFHATLKPPFALAHMRSEAQLLDAVGRLVDAEVAFTLPPLQLTAIGRFLAFVPSAPCPRVNALANLCVTEIDEFREPPNDSELARRRAAQLTARQDALLARWGYPYVFDEYRFHMTLTGGLDAAMRERLLSVLNVMAEPILRDPISMTSLSVMIERSPGSDFVLLKRFPLRTA